MTDSTLETVLRRDRIGRCRRARDYHRAGMGLCALARYRHGHGRHGHDRISHDPGWHGDHGAGERRHGKRIEFAYVFAMWAVMMVGMMAPSAAPMILLYARVGRQGKDSRANRSPRRGWFATGYFLAWSRLFTRSNLSRNGRSNARLCSDPTDGRAPATYLRRRSVLIAAGRLPMDAA